MSVILTIDYRETKLYNAILKNISTHFNSQNVATEIIKYGNLDIGDIHITSVKHNFNLIFERKTEADLAASIKDGRYREQKYRMLNTNSCHHCAYIIEGDSFGGISSMVSDDIIQKQYGITHSVYTGAIIHTLFRDKMHVLFTKDIDDTSKLILQIFYKCINNPDKFSTVLQNDDKTEYVSHVKAKTRKIENMTKETCYILQLCQIPGISQKIACEIKNIYPTMKDLIYAVHNCPEEHRAQIISKIPMIGPKKAKIIVEYII